MATDALASLMHGPLAGNVAAPARALASDLADAAPAWLGPAEDLASALGLGPGSPWSGPWG